MYGYDVTFYTGSLSHTGIIAYSSESSDGNYEIYKINPDGSAQTQLTDNNTINEIKPVISPDGKYIVFQNMGVPPINIYRMNVDGSNLVQLTSDAGTNSSPVWSPDGSRIAFISTRAGGNGSIYSMNADGTDVTRLTDTAAGDQKPTWSPDGNKIAFISLRDGTASLYVMNADGSDETKFAVTNWAGVKISWSPDSQRIVYSEKHDAGIDDIYVIKADGTKRTRLTSNSQSFYPAWSPDGSKIVFISSRAGSFQIFVMNNDGSQQTMLANGGNNSLEYAPVWSLDSKSIAFLRNNTSGYPDIYKINSSGDGLTVLTATSSIEQYLNWGTNVTSVFVTTNQATDVTGETAILNGSLISLGNDSEVRVSFQWGTVSGNLTNETDPEVMNTRGTFEAEITGLTDNIYYFKAKAVVDDVSYYGEEKSFETTQFSLIIALNGNGSTSPSAGTHYYITGTIVDITATPAANWYFAGWTGDTVANSTWASTQVTMNSNKSLTANFSQTPPYVNAIAFVSERDGNSEIYTIHSDACNLIRLTSNENYDIYPDWSPDGTELLFGSYRNSDDGLYVMDSNGANQTNLTSYLDETYPADWSPDGSQLSYVYNGGGYNDDIWLINSDGTNRHLLASTSGYDNYPKWSPDGTKVAFLSLQNNYVLVYVVDADGTDELSLTTSGRASSLNWSSDSSKIVFVLGDGQDRDLYTIDIDGSNLTQLTSDTLGHNDPVYSPDGTNIAFTTYYYENYEYNGEIYVMNTGDRTQYRLTNSSGNDYDPCWSPDGTQIAFVSQRDGNNEIYVMDVDGSDQERLTNNSASDSYPIWNPATITGNIVFITNTQVIAAGSVSNVITVQTQDLSGNPVNATKNIGINLATNSSNGKFDTSASGQFDGSITSITIPFGSSQASFYYKDTTAGTPVISVASSGYTGGFQSETVTPSVKNKLVWGTQPPTPVTAGAVWTAFTVKITDQYGNQTADTDGVTITSFSGTLGGTTSKAAVAGLATFSNITRTLSGTLTLKASSGTLTSTLVSNTITINPAETTQIRVETAADGGGTVVPAQSITVGNSIMVYAVTRDQYDNFVANAAGTWSLVNKTSGIEDTDLVAAGNNKSATFTGHTAGTANIHTVSSGLTSTDSGTITVNSSSSGSGGESSGGGGEVRRWRLSGPHEYYRA